MLELYKRPAQPTREETIRLGRLGVKIDGLGRPVNPHFVQDFGHKGLVQGKGMFYYWGPNHTVDPVVIGQENNTPKVLTIVRGDNGLLALPGGFIDLGELPLSAAIREAHEETGLDISQDPHETIYNGQVNDPRDTLHAWAETTAILFRHDGCPPVIAGDDARPGSAVWLPLAELAEASLHGAHAMIIAKAMRRYHELAQPTTR